MHVRILAVAVCFTLMSSCAPSTEKASEKLHTETPESQISSSSLSEAVSSENPASSKAEEPESSFGLKHVPLDVTNAKKECIITPIALPELERGDADSEGLTYDFDNPEEILKIPSPNGENVINVFMNREIDYYCEMGLKLNDSESAFFYMILSESIYVPLDKRIVWLNDDCIMLDEGRVFYYIKEERLSERMAYTNFPYLKCELRHYFAEHIAVVDGKVYHRPKEYIDYTGYVYDEGYQYYMGRTALNQSATHIAYNFRHCWLYDLCVYDVINDEWTGVCEAKDEIMDMTFDPIRISWTDEDTLVYTVGDNTAQNLKICEFNVKTRENKALYDLDGYENCVGRDIIKDPSYINILDPHNVEILYDIKSGRFLKVA